jgi:hypothetical protein
MSPSAPHRIRSIAKLARKKFVQQYYTERAGAIRSLENVNSIKLCLSLFAVRLEMLDLLT